MNNISSNIYNNFSVKASNDKNSLPQKEPSFSGEKAVQNDNTDLNKNPNCIYNQMKCQRLQKTEGIPRKTAYQGNVDCIIGGALGDALGRPVERLRSDQMLEYYGKEGIRDLATVGMKARITDDTQMTMFTADGLIKSAIKNGRGSNPDYDIIFNSYKDWYNTQTQGYEETNPKHGWLSSVEDLYSPVGPGRTCLSSLKNGVPGTLENPINSSSGCGGVMRVAPVGLMYDDPKQAFEIGARCAALTHGGPNAYLPAGFHAAVVSCIRGGQSLEEAFNSSLEILKTYDNYEETYNLITKAMKLAKSDVPSDRAIESLGYGFLGHEAMAISTYAIFKEPDNLKDALILAVNHSGDSDSTGAITGNILGLYLGTDTIPSEWLEYLELTDEMKTLSRDMSDVDSIQDAADRYPVK